MEIQPILLVMEILSLAKVTVSISEYFLMFPFQSETFEDDTSGFTIYNPNSVPVQIRFQEPLISSNPFNIDPGSHQYFDTFGKTYQMEKETGYFSKKGILILATADVIVFALKRIMNSGDMFLVPPSHHSGKLYVAVTAYTPSSNYNCFVAVCSTSKATQVRFNLPKSILGGIIVGAKQHIGGDTINVTLGQLECFQLITNEDFTGLFIESNVSVTAFSGADNFRTSHVGVEADYIITDLPALSLSGTLYILQPLELDIIKIISTTTSTQVHVVGKCINEKEQLLDSYMFKEYTISCVVTITANKPIFVAHFPMTDSNVQHPALYFVTPVERYSDTMMVYSARKPTAKEQKCKLFISAVIQATTNNISFAFDLNTNTVKLKWTHEFDPVHHAYTNVEVISDFLTVMNSSEVKFGGYLTCFTSNQAVAVPFVSQKFSSKLKQENSTQANIPHINIGYVEGTTSTAPSSSDSQAPISDVSTATTPPSTSDAVSASGGRNIQTSSYSTHGFLVTKEDPDWFTTSTVSEVSTYDPTPQNSTTQMPCNCNICSANTVFLELNETTSEIKMVVERLQRTLTVRKNRTSAWLRTKNSAEDDRPSAKGIGGTICAVTFSFVFCVIVIPDLMTLVSFIKKRLQTLTNVRQPETITCV